MRRSLNQTALILFAISIITFVSSLQLQDSSFLTINSSYNRYTLSTSIATNLEGVFLLKSPLLIEQGNHQAEFTTQAQTRFQILPKFIKDQEFLYNDYSQGEYWYGFKKSFVSEDPPILQSKFAYAQIISVDGSTKNDMIMPMFGMPLGFLDFARLYKCSDLLISYQETAASMMDLTIFSTKSRWHLFPNAKWGFRQKEQEISYSRQTYPFGTQVELDIGNDQYCVIDDKLSTNVYDLGQAAQKEVFELNDLLKLSKDIEIKKLVDPAVKETDQTDPNDQEL